MKILALDPSVNNCGYALYDSAKRNNKTKGWKMGTWKLEGSNYQMRLVDLYQYIIVEIGKVDHLVTEWPSFFSSEKGQLAAHQNYTIDLAGICAYIAGRLGLDHRQWHNVTAIQWKGAVPKLVTMRKFERVFKKNIRFGKVDEHAIDAIMLARYWLSTFGRQVFANAKLVIPESLELLLGRV